MASFIEITDADFDSQINKADKPILVDFWAPWCGPCRAIAPILEELAVELKDKLIIAKVNVDDNKGVAGKLGIRSIPTMVVFKGGQEAQRLVGAQSKDALKESLSRIL